MCEYSNENENENTQKDIVFANNRKSVQNLINKFEQLNYVPVTCKVRIDNKSSNIMTDGNSNHAFPILDQNVVNKFLQSQNNNNINNNNNNNNNSSFKSSGSVREVKSKSEQKKRSESLRSLENKNLEKYQGNKNKTSNSSLNKYFRSLSDSLSNKRNSPATNSKWYSQEVVSKSKEMKTIKNVAKKRDETNKSLIPKGKSFTNGQKKKIREDETNKSLIPKGESFTNGQKKKIREDETNKSLIPKGESFTNGQKKKIREDETNKSLIPKGESFTNGQKKKIREDETNKSLIPKGESFTNGQKKKIREDETNKSLIPKGESFTNGQKKKIREDETNKSLIPKGESFTNGQKKKIREDETNKSLIPKGASFTNGQKKKIREDETNKSLIPKGESFTNGQKKKIREDETNKSLIPKGESFTNGQKKKSRVDTVPKEKNDDTSQKENVIFRRKNSYVMAMQANFTIDINIDEPQKQEEEYTTSSYVSKILSKFEDRQSNNTIKQEVQTDIDQLFKNYHRKAKISEKNREQLSLEINNTLLQKYKQLRSSSHEEESSAGSSRINSKTELLVPPEALSNSAELSRSNTKAESKFSHQKDIKEIEFIRSSADFPQFHSKTESEEEETKVVALSNSAELSRSNSKTESVFFHEEKTKVCRSSADISELNSKTESDEEETKVLVTQTANSETESALLEEETEDVEFITLVYNEDDGKLTRYSGEEYADMETKYMITLNETLDPDKEEIQVFQQNGLNSKDENETEKNARVLYDKIQEQLNDVIKKIEDEEMALGDSPIDDPKRNKFEFWRQQSTPDEIKNSKEEKVIIAEDDSNISNQRRSSCIFSSMSTNSDIPEDKPRLSRLYSGSFKRSSQVNEESKNKVETRNSFFNNFRLSFKSNSDEDDRKNRRSFRNSLFDKKEENKSDERRNSYLARRKSCFKGELPETPGIEEKQKTKQEADLLSPNRNSFLNMRRNSYTSDIPETAEEKSTKNSVLRSKSLKGLPSQEKSADNVPLISSDNKLRHSRLYSGKFRRSSTQEKEDVAAEEPKEDSFKRQETPRSSRLYKHTPKSNTESQDDNNNKYEAPFKYAFLQFESDNDDEDEPVEICNPTLNCVQKDAYTKEWVQNTVELLSLQTVKEPQPREEEQFSTTQLRKTVDKNGLKTCTVYDEQNNPAIRLSCYDILMDEKFEDEETVHESEKVYRDSIENIQNNSQLACLVAELKSTEHNYVKLSLRRLVEDYMPEMSRKDIPLNLVGKVRTIFGNADILYENHKLKFLPALEAAKSVEDIADCFLKYEEKIFKYYPLYTKNKPKSELIMRDYADFFKCKQELLQDRLDLSSYLLTPIQRMAKYCQLVKSMGKECEKEGNPSEKLTKASEMLAKLMSKGNDLIALDSIRNFDGDLRQEGDLLLRNTFLVQPPNRKQSYEGMIFLFQESILITQITRYNGSELFVYQDSIKVCDMGYTDNQAEPLVFKIWYRKRDQKNYVIRANKKEQQQKWVKEIFNLLWKQLEANKMRKKKEYEESGLNETKLLLPRPISEPNNKNMFKSRNNCTMKKKPSSDTIWYSTFLKKFDFGDS